MPQYTNASGRVFIVGAGPGDPGLLTLRGKECLQQAELILYDELVSPRILDYATPTAKKVGLQSLAEKHNERSALALKQAIAAAQTGKVVVRLKGGDPAIFGRCFEETALLRAAGVPYEIVPGVTAASAASAYAEIPLTHREHSSSVVFLTGHECPDKAGETTDWPQLARTKGTLAIYMGMKRLEEVAERLIQHGMRAETPAAVVEWASTPRQRRIQGTLATIARHVAEAGLHNPAVVLLGPAVALTPHASWFEQRPLLGQTVLVTRPEAQAAGMVRELELLGATVYLAPVLEIGPPPDATVVQQALQHLSHYHWLVFTSTNGVHSFLRHLRQMGKDLRALGHLRLAAIGPQTAAALAEYHLQADVIPPEYRSESLAEHLLPHVKGQKVLLARADRGREILLQELVKVAEVSQIAVYRQIDRPGLPEPVPQLLREGKPLYVTLTSANIARRFLTLLPEGAHRQNGQTLRLVSISPVTTEAIRERGFAVAAEATEYTTAGVVAALITLVRQTGTAAISAGL
jgi:uroporphyrinogen III methyltransferase/synthase